MSEKLKRFAVFAGDDYYPAGGWADFQGSFDSIEGAHAAANVHDKGGKWWHVIDLTAGEDASTPAQLGKLG